MPSTGRGSALTADPRSRPLTRTLGRFDMVFFSVAVLVGLDLIGQAASHGPQALTWTVLMVVLFLVPYGMVMAEVGAAFTAEGGPYEWVKLSFGRAWAGFNTILYWITNPLWVGGSLAFIATQSFDTGIAHLDGAGPWGYVFKLSFIWLTIGSAIVSLRIGKWIPNVGAILKVALVAMFAVTVGLYAARHGAHGLTAHALTPSTAGLLAIAPLVLFSFVGFEGVNGAGEEMRQPQRDVPIAILRSGALATLCYVVPIVLLLIVLPTSAITGLGGFLDAVRTSYHGVYGAAAGPMYTVTCALFILTLVNSGASWMMCGDRVLAVAAADGAFFPAFGGFHPRLGTPLRANLLSGALASAFCVAATVLLSSSAAAAFGVVLNMAVSTTLLSYVLIFPAVVVLRIRRPEVGRPFRVPGRTALPLALASALITAWVVLGSWTAVAPGTLDRLLGHRYSFTDAWGVSQLRFELFTGATLAAMTVMWLIGYAAAARWRRGATAGSGRQATALEPEAAIS